MLYTFANTSYSLQELELHLSQITDKDAVLLWQDGIFLLWDHLERFQSLPINTYVLKEELIAKGLDNLFIIKADFIKSIDFIDFIKLTEIYYPQMAL